MMRPIITKDVVRVPGHMKLEWTKSEVMSDTYGYNLITVEAMLARCDADMFPAGGWFLSIRRDRDFGQRPQEMLAQYPGYNKRVGGMLLDAMDEQSALDEATDILVHTLICEF